MADLKTTPIIIANGAHTWQCTEAGRYSLAIGTVQGDDFDSGSITVNIGTKAIHSDWSVMTAGDRIGIFIAFGEILTVNAVSIASAGPINFSCKKVD